jgi:hypothetical protein
MTFLSIAACGGQSAKTKDDAPAHSGSDASAEGSTHVTGVLGGTAFVLGYGAISRDASGLIWVCAANVPVAYSDCSSTSGPARIMFLGPFGYDQSNNPRWSTPQLGLFRTGTSPLSEMATTGSLTVQNDDPNSGALQLMLNVNFGETPTTSGTVSVGP